MQEPCRRKADPEPFSAGISAPPPRKRCGGQDAPGKRKHFCFSMAQAVPAHKNKRSKTMPRNGFKERAGSGNGLRGMGGTSGAGSLGAGFLRHRKRRNPAAGRVLRDAPRPTRTTPWRKRERARAEPTPAPRMRVPLRRFRPCPASSRQDRDGRTRSGSRGTGCRRGPEFRLRGVRG